MPSRPPAPGVSRSSRPPRRDRLRATVALGLACALLAQPLQGLDLADLQSDQGLTPKKFAGMFEPFEFEYHREIQWPNVFLGEQRGDCDDYAVLADHVLRPKGYATRVIHIRLVGRVAHAICYVAESKAYLDFNNRKYAINLARSGRTLREIATKIAADFEANWTSASEFTYDYETSKKTFGRTVVKTEPRANDADLKP